MEIRIVIFLVFVFVSVASNTLLIWLAYKAFANVTTRVTKTVLEFGKNGETREWIESLRVAAEQAAMITETTKQKMAEFAPALDHAQQNFNRTLVKVDSTLEEVAAGIDSGTRKVQDVITKPAIIVMEFAANLTKSVDQT